MSNLESILINCPICGASVSKYALSCPKCGHPISASSNEQEAVNTGQNQTVIIQQPTRKSNGVGVAGFVLSLIAFILSWVPGVSWVIWFLGFVLSLIGMFKPNKGLAIAGFVISIIDVILLIALVGTVASMFI